MNAEATFVKVIVGVASQSASAVNSTAMGYQFAAQKANIIFAALSPNVTAVCDPSMFVITGTKTFYFIQKYTILNLQQSIDQTSIIIQTTTTTAAGTFFKICFIFNDITHLICLNKMAATTTANPTNLIQTILSSRNIEILIIVVGVLIYVLVGGFTSCIVLYKILVKSNKVMQS